MHGVVWFLAFPAVVGVSAAVTVVAAVNTGQDSKWYRLGIASLFAAGFAYAAALAALFRDPVWDDNGSPTALQWPEHCVWAMPFATLAYPAALAVIGVAGYARARYRKSRHQ